MKQYSEKTRETACKCFQYALEGDEDAVKERIDKNFNLEDCDENGNSLLHFAVRGKNRSLVRFLVEQCRMSPTWMNQEMISPFDLAHMMYEEMPELQRYFEKQCGFSYEECYRNPVARGMHADPSIVRVGEDYYMVNSSFIYFPGIPVSHSKDLIHWRVIGHVIVDADWAEQHLGRLNGGRGFWAPDISYHNGRFYVCATLRNNDDAEFIQTQMVTSAQNPEGPYETPVIHNVLGIDPSLFTDEDGKRYMLLNRGARLMEVSDDGRQILSKPEMIWYGHSGHAPEGPHLLKKDGYYYCFLAEGGTGTGHMITVARSRNLKGPYEECPYNPIMTQRDSNAPIQCCGHGKPVQTEDGRWYMVYLCSRYLAGRWGMLGRETCLEEMIWTEDGWPVLNHGKGPSYMNRLPFLGNETESIQTEKEKESAWYTVRSKDSRYVKLLCDTEIEINGCGHDLNELCCRSLAVRNQPDFSFTFEVQMSVDEESFAKKEDCQKDAGVTLYYDENTYIKFGISFGADGKEENKVFVTEYVDDRYVRRIEKEIPDRTEYLFLVETAGLKRSFYENGEFLASFDDVTSLCSEGLIKGKRFTGATYGVYVNGNGRARFTVTSKNDEMQ